MADVKIVCDASYDDTIMLTGYAGGIYASEENRSTVTHMYQGVEGELQDIQEGELTAILVGLKELKSRTDASRLSVDRLEIFTDSKSSILKLVNIDTPIAENLNSHTYNLFTEIQSICRQAKWSPIIEHVSAHINSLNANGIERLNQLADKMANDARKVALSQLLQPNNKEGSAVSVLLPRNMRSKEEVDAFFDFGKKLAGSGKSIRVYIEGDERSHPFLDGVLHAQSFVSDLPGAHFYNYDTELRNQGLNTTLYRHYVLHENLNSRFEITNSPTEKRAVISSNLIFGDLANKKSRSGVKNNACSVIYDTMNPTDRNASTLPDSVQGWVSLFSEKTKTPVISGLRNAMRHIGLELDITVTTRPTQSKQEIALSKQQTFAGKDITKSIESIIERYRGDIELNQLAIKINDEFVSNGYPNNSLFSDSITRFVFSSANMAAGKLSDKLLKQANKMFPAKVVCDEPPEHKLVFNEYAKPKM